MKLNSLTGVILLTAAAAFAQDPPSRVARLNLIDGPVSFQPASVDDWTNATLNYPLTTGDHLFSDQGARAEMHIGPNAIQLGSGTNFGFLNLDDRTIQVRLTEGAINIRLRALGEDDAWEIDTPNGAITLLRNGDYRIDTDAGRNATMVTVRGGDAEITAGGQAFTVHPRQTAYFTGDGAQPDVRDANPPDEFDRWSADRARREDALPPPRYVSRDMVGYEDLEGYGTWTEVPEYGAIWRPRVAAGWVPYHEGRWAWVEPWGWTWIDAAPWGFAPFHYGRWAFIGGGWGWSPGPRIAIGRPVYAPALVAFVGGGGWGASISFGAGGGVGWFPLGFNEAYLPGYHVSQNYVRRVNVTNVTNVTVINNVVNNYNNPTYVRNIHYANQTVQGAVIAVPRRAFVSNELVHRAAVDVPARMVSNAPVAGFSAPVAPERGSILRSPEGRVARPSDAVFNRPVVARGALPPAQIPFAARQEVLRQNEGRPASPEQLQSIRGAVPVRQPPVRIVDRQQGPSQVQPSSPVQVQPIPRDRMSQRPPTAAQPVPQQYEQRLPQQPQRQVQQQQLPNAPPAQQQPIPRTVREERRQQEQPPSAPAQPQPVPRTVREERRQPPPQQEQAPVRREQPQEIRRQERVAPRQEVAPAPAPRQEAKPEKKDEKPRENKDDKVKGNR